MVYYLLIFFWLLTLIYVLNRYKNNKPRQFMAGVCLLLIQLIYINTDYPPYIIKFLHDRSGGPDPDAVNAITNAFISTIRLLIHYIGG